MTPPRKLCTSTSAVATSWWMTALPSGAFRSSAMLRLLRLRQAKGMLTPSTNGPHMRLQSSAAGPFDLDDVGAEVGEELGGDRPLEDMAEVEDADAGEGFGGGWFGLHFGVFSCQRESFKGLNAQWASRRVLEWPIARTGAGARGRFPGSRRAPAAATSRSSMTGSRARHCSAAWRSPCTAASTARRTTASSRQHSSAMGSG